MNIFDIAFKTLASIIMNAIKMSFKVTFFVIFVVTNFTFMFLVFPFHVVATKSVQTFPSLNVDGQCLNTV